MSTKRTAYWLTRDQVLAVCDAMNTQTAARMKLAETMKGDCKLLLDNRSKADAALVRAFIDGLKREDYWPFDRHHAFASQAEIDAE